MRASIRKTILTLLLTLCFAAGLMPGAMAEGTAKEYPDSFFEGRTWDEIMDEFVQQHKVIEGTITAGYKNLVTGEEHYFDPDRLLLSASMYKVPLNMYWSNKIFEGEEDWSFNVKGHKYEDVIKWSIVNSDNEFSMALCDKFGGLRPYREAMLALVGETEDSVDPLFFRNNYYTSRQMIFCMEELYNNSEKYPKVLDYMKIAKPGKYFKEHENGVEIAHKFGYLFEGHSVANDCGIVYTEEPFAIVVFTCNAYHGYEFLVDFFDMMVAYTNYHTRVHKAQAELERARSEKLEVIDQSCASEQASLEEQFLTASERLEQMLRSMMAEEDSIDRKPSKEQSGIQEHRSAAGGLIAAAGAAAALVMLTFILLSQKRRQPVLIAGCILLLAASGGLAATVFGNGTETGSAAKSGTEPQEALKLFEALEWEKTGSTQTDRLGQLMAESIRVGEINVLEGENATHLRVSCTGLDGTMAQKRIQQTAEEMIQQYRAEILECEEPEADSTDYTALVHEAYADALELYLSQTPGDLKTSEAELSFVYRQGQWLAVENERVLAALLGK